VGSNPTPSAIQSARILLVERINRTALFSAHFGGYLRCIAFLWVPFLAQRRVIVTKFSHARHACPFQNGLKSSNSVLSAIQSALA
jgi:hypothetical protein